MTSAIDSIIEAEEVGRWAEWTSSSSGGPISAGVPAIGGGALPLACPREFSTWHDSPAHLECLIGASRNQLTRDSAFALAVGPTLEPVLGRVTLGRNA